MSDLIAGDFNYASVDSDTATSLEHFAKRGKALMRKSQIQFIAEFGQILSEARAAISHHGDGLFVKWATAEFDIGKSTVYNYVNAWDKCLSNGWTNYINWSPTALYLASAEDFPKPVMKKLEKIPATELVRACDVKRLIEAAKPKPEPEPEEEPSNEDGVTSEEEWSDGTTLEVVDADESDVPFDAPDAPPEAPQASVMLDSLGKQIPKNFASASELAIQLNSIGRELDKYRKIAKDFSEKPGGEWLRLQNIDDYVRSLKNQFQDARYHTVCPRCNGKGKDCKKCNGVGWIPDYLKGTI